MNDIVLKYVGDVIGSYVPGVPGCDLTQAMIDESGYTVAQLLAFHSGDQPVYIEVTNG